MTYPELLAAVRAGRRIPANQAGAAIAAAGKSADDFLVDLFPPGEPTAQPGDPCPECGGRLSVVNSRLIGLRRVQYIGCRACGHRPPRNKITGPPESVLRRSKPGWSAPAQAGQ